MAQVSYIVCGDNASRRELDEIKMKMSTTFRDAPDLVDLVLYFTNRPLPFFSSENLSVVSSSDFPSSIKSSIVAASGGRIIFTTPHNFLADKENEMLDLAISSPIVSVGVPLEKKRLGKILGARLLLSPSYLVVDKGFALKAAPVFKSYRKLIKSADQKLGLSILSPLKIPAADFIIRPQIILRPYRAIAKNQLVKSKYGNSRKHVSDSQSLELSKKPIKFSRDIPVFIISRDRLKALKQLLNWCEKESLTNIIIIDNSSTYPPLLRFYSSVPHKVIGLSRNIGQTSPWVTGAVDVYAKDKPFIVTDSDIIPLPNAHGAVRLFCKLLNDYPERIKAGFGLVIDDIPDSYALKDYVIAWESQFWQKEIEKDVYDADIDTTFAVNRQGIPYDIRDSLRTGGRFLARHETWYTDSKKPSAEMKYYRAHANKGIGSWGTNHKELSNVYHDHKHSSKKSQS